MTGQAQEIPADAARLDIKYWLSSNLFAVVSCDAFVAFVREPGERTEDELRALLNAPADATVQRVRQPEPGGPHLRLTTWPCHVCLRERYDAQVSVAYWSSGNAAAPVVNVRYCNDREQCVEVATAPGIWPPRQATDWCIPGLALHTNPHRGCLLDPTS